MFYRFFFQLAVLLLLLVGFLINLNGSQVAFSEQIDDCSSYRKDPNDLKKYSIEELENELQVRLARNRDGRDGRFSPGDIEIRDRNSIQIAHYEKQVHADARPPGETFERDVQKWPESPIHDARSSDISYNYSKQTSLSFLNSVKKEKPRFLWGIFSMNSKGEVLKRQSIRETYLSFYKTLPGANSSHEYYHRICSLHEYKLWRKSNDRKYFSCHMIYAFVVGSNTDANAHTDLCEATQEDPLYPLTVAETSNDSASKIVSSKKGFLLATEEDIVHLNIKENMNQGKTTSWYRYGVSLIDGAGDDELHFDYIVKVDGDKLVFPDQFFHQMKVLNLPVNPSKETELVFGGYPAIFGPNSIQAQWLEGTPFYMSGEMYFLSVSLARYVISDGLNRTKFDSYRPNNKRGHEDLSMGKFVFSHPNHENILFIKIKQRGDPIGPHGNSKSACILRMMDKIS